MSEVAGAIAGEHTPRGEAHAPPSALAFQFDDSAQQHEAATLGMWLFLGTELMFFGGVFTAYAIFRWKYPEAFGAGSRLLNTTLGAINTAVLLTSSLTMALAVREAQLARMRNVVRLLLLTMLLGAAFLGIKAVEWTHDWHEGLIPGLNFTYPNHHDVANPGQLELFFWVYFFLTGLHGLHMIIGLVAVGIIASSAWRRRATASMVEIMGLYWHFIDIIWVFLYPLLYLIELVKHP